MKSVVRPIRMPDDLDRAVIRLMESQDKSRTQLVRGALMIAWQDYFVNELGANRMKELLTEYHWEKKGDEE